MQLTLKTPVQYLPRVGPTMAKRLEKLGILTAEDLLYHAPFRYNDFSLISPIARVQPGEIVTIHATIQDLTNIYTKHGKKIQKAVVADDSGVIPVIWFNQPFLVKTLPPGTVVSLAGPIRWFGNDMVVESPQYEILQATSEPVAKRPALHTGRLVPVYPETAGVSSKWLRARIAQALQLCQSQIQDYLPALWRSQYRLLSLPSALRQVHFPETQAMAQAAHRRLAFDELLLLQLRAQKQRQRWESTRKAHPIRYSPQRLKQFMTNLPFQLTQDQKQSTDEILTDLSRSVPMNRLLEGDVGAGKTVVATMAIYAVFKAGFQSVLMAPTQILATQHFVSVRKLLEPFGVAVTLVTGKQKKGTGELVHVYVGTHALLSKSLPFRRVGLIVIDEQQRFGVAQRSLLIEKGKALTTPHLLTMTATPIPRTLAKTIYAHLDLSVLSQMPTGRIPIKTWVVPRQKREGAYSWIRQQLTQNKTQAFIVCPLIEESETLTSVRAAKTEFERLKAAVYPDLRLGLLHGRMKPKEKTAVLDEFRMGGLDILVTTPVVEVGIDIPNATMMLVEAAERFGLSQLHQLRGRVGRRDKPSYCLLFTEQEQEHILARLKALETVHNGPQLAELDLTLRGPGELSGTKQHGLPDLKIATLSDTALVHETQKAVGNILTNDPDLRQFPLLSQKLTQSTIQTTVQD